ncbi:putative ATP-dependent endonuclease of OLD family [Pseudomonas sp. BIGb0408]|uniref:Putative ATP-dependent endonuclease of OLD family n=1 Tax=Phytopseudomonas flavescens TaxID=29435 RepID=A0A7Z0BNW4_9GAMM|nr:MULTISPECIES: TOPRIM nucleotidyl transferase/hydrolase domain-containing protein [Pseudomonas]MCW2293170.1 putative ATP-dependent endonuclease of OLD family [Pseudomonas sp. BIGb0408]NYH72259.1 putative ATP-dependent endonuclease of OLD family [Pseudomonas flavescens]
MKLFSLGISGFQSFGPGITTITFEDVTYLLGPNGAGKTATLQALARMFGFEPALRRLRRSDFHVPLNEQEVPEQRTLWIEADFTFEETVDDEDDDTVPPFFSQMTLRSEGDVPRIRFRLEGVLHPDGDVEERFVYVTRMDEDGQPTTVKPVAKRERDEIQLHYLPARRDPADHVAYGATALLGRLLRAVNWSDDRDSIKELTDQITDCLSSNESIKALSNSLSGAWQQLHRGDFFASPSLTFANSEIEAILRHLSISFSPGHGESQVDYARLSDGQKSMLYLSLVLTSLTIGREVRSGQNTSFDPMKLKPSAFTILAVEEPENSLSPHYLGRIVSSLKSCVGVDAQALIATQAPSMLRRVEPEHIRYLRLNARRETDVSTIALPQKRSDAYKFVREAVQAFPELYFARLVVLGEGDSEEIVLPRILQAKGAPVDESAVAIAPLGGRHVNHFWRLLNAIGTPHITLLDLDVGRHQGGWGRVGYVRDQLDEFAPARSLPQHWERHTWNDADVLVRTHHWFDKDCDLFADLEARDVFFSEPLDLDFAMLKAFPNAFGAVSTPPTPHDYVTVLGKSHFNPGQYDATEQQLFAAYHKLFKLSSKPAAHLDALGNLSDPELLASLPPSLSRLADRVIAKLDESPE